MEKRTLKLEFEYSSRRFTNEIGVDVVEYHIKPAGALKDIFPAGFKRKMQSIADQPDGLATSLSIAASSLKEYLQHLTDNRYGFSEYAEFKDGNDEITRVIPAIYTPH